MRSRGGHLRPLLHGSTRKLRRSMAAGLVGVTLLAVTACAKPATERDPLRPPSDHIHLYGTDGNMMNSLGEAVGEEYPDALAGMKGTAPLTRLSETFKRRLLAQDKGLKDFLYAGESYDAVVISALAAQIAGTTNPRAIADQINGVTAGGTICETPAACLSLVAASQDIAYRGVSLTLGGFTDAGEPSAGTYGILRFAGQNTLDDAQTEYVPTGDRGNETTKQPPASTGGGGAPLRIGTLLPRTGDLASAGPPMFAGVTLAVNEINDAGGILGSDITLTHGDDGTDAKVAQATVDRLIRDASVHVIIGAGASSITQAVLPSVMAAGRVLFSPCNTAASLTTADDQGLYFRTAPPDGLQATALTDIIMRDGVRRIYIVARDDAYGKGLMDSVRADLVDAGLDRDDIKAVPYSPDSPDFADLGTDIKAFGPDGALIIGFDESADALSSIMKAGLKSRLL
jgi:ABC-type branched-subunit amino acid transport system substrate-binding protein